MYEEFTGLTYEEAKQYCTAPIESMKPHDQRIIRLMIKSARDMDGTVLDVGCGTGRLAGEFDEDKYLGIDVSPILIRVARELHPDRRFMEMNAEKMIFWDKMFDNVLCGGVLPHMPSEKVAVNIIKKMVRITGKLLQITWSTIPRETTLIKHLVGHFGRPTYQNQYSRSAVMKVIPKSAKLVEDTFNGCALWRIYL